MESPVEEEGKSLPSARVLSPTSVHQAGRSGTPGGHQPDGTELHAGALRDQLPDEKRVIRPEPGEKQAISPEPGNQNRLHKVSGGTDVFPDITSASYARTLSGSSPTEIITSTVTEIIYLETRTTSPRPPAADTETPMAEAAALVTNTGAPVGTTTEVPVISTETHGVSSESALASTETHVTSSENTVASCENTRASCENAVTNNAIHVSSSENVMTSSESTVASYENTVASSESNVTTSESIVTSSESTVASSENSVTSSGNVMASSESTVVVSESTVSRAEGHRANTEAIRMNTEAPLADTKTLETITHPRPASSLNTETPAAGTEASVAATETRLVKTEVFSSKTEARSVSRETSSVVINASPSPCVSMTSTEATEISTRASSGEVETPSSKSEGPMANCRAPGINLGTSSVSPNPPSAKPEVPAGKPKGPSTKYKAPAPSTSPSPRHEVLTFHTENASTRTEGLTADAEGHSPDAEGHSADAESPSATTEGPSASKENSASVVVSAPAAAASPTASPTTSSSTTAAAPPTPSPITSSSTTAAAPSTATLAMVQPLAGNVALHTSPSALGDTQAPSSVFLVTRASCASSTCSSSSIERRSGFATPLPTGTLLQHQRLLQEGQGKQGAATEATRVVSVVSDSAGGSGGSSVDGNSSAGSVGIGDTGDLVYVDDEVRSGGDEIFVSFRRSVMENFRLSGYSSDDELNRGVLPRTPDSGATPPAAIQPETSTTTNDMRGASAAKAVVNKVANTSVTGGIAAASSARGGSSASMGRSSSWDEDLGGFTIPSMLDGTKTWSGATSRRATPYQNTSEHFHSTRVIRCSGKTRSVTGNDAAFLAAGDGRDATGFARGTDFEEPREPRAPEATVPADSAAVAAGVDVAIKDGEALVADDTAADGAGVAVDGVGGAFAGADTEVSSGVSSGCSASTTAGVCTLASSGATASASASVDAETSSWTDTSISVGVPTSVSATAGVDAPKVTSRVPIEQDAPPTQESAPEAQRDEKKERASRRAAFLAAQDFYALSKTAKATQRTFKSRRGFTSADGTEGAGRLTKETISCESSGRSKESGGQGGASSSLGRTLSTGDTKSDDEGVGVRGDGGASPMITTQKEIANVVSSIVNKGTYLTLRTKRSASREGATSAGSGDGPTDTSSPSERDSPVTIWKSEREFVVSGSRSPGMVRSSSWQVKRNEEETTQGYAERIDETLLSLRGESRGTPSPGVLRRSEGYNLSPHAFRGGEFDTRSPMVCGSARGGSMSPLVYRRSAAGGNLSPLVSRRSDVLGSLKVEVSRTEEKTTTAAAAKAEEEGAGASSKSGKTGMEKGSEEATEEGQKTKETGAEEEPPSELPAKGFVADKLSIFNAVAGGAGSPVVMRKSTQVKESSRAQVTREVTTSTSTRVSKEAESGRPRVAGPSWGAPDSRPGVATGETCQPQWESQTTVRELVSGSGTVVRGVSAQVAVSEEEAGTHVGGHRPDMLELVEKAEELVGRTASPVEGDATAKSIALTNQSLHISSTQEGVTTAPSTTPTGDLEEEAVACSSDCRPAQKDGPVSESRISGRTSVVSSSVSRVSSSTFTSQAQSYTTIRSLVTPRVATPKKEMAEELSAVLSSGPPEAGKTPSAETRTSGPAETLKAPSAGVSISGPAEAEKAPSAEISIIGSTEVEKAPSAEISTSGFAEAEKAPSTGTSTIGPEVEKAPSAETSTSDFAEAKKAPLTGTSTIGPEVETVPLAETRTSGPAEAVKAPSAGTSTSGLAEAEKAPSARTSTSGFAGAEKAPSAGTSTSGFAEAEKAPSAGASTSSLAEAVKVSSARISSSSVSQVSSVRQVNSVSQVTTVSQVTCPTSAKKHNSAASISVSPPPPPLSPKPVRLPLSAVSPSSPPPPPVSPKPVKLPQAPVSPPLSPRSSRLSVSNVDCVSSTFESGVSSIRNSSASLSSTVSISSLSSRSSPAERDLSEDEVTVISYRCATPNYPSNSEIRTDGSRSPLVSDSASDTERTSDGREEVIRAGLVADRRAIFSGACTPLLNTPRRSQLEGPPPSAQEDLTAEASRTSKGRSETRAIVKSRVIVRGPGTRVVLPAEGPSGSLSHSERPFSPAGKDTATSWSRQVIWSADPQAGPSTGPRGTTGPPESRVTSSSGAAGPRTAFGSSESQISAGKAESRLLGEARTESQVTGGLSSATSQMARGEAAKWQSPLGGETGREITAGTAEWQTTTVRSSKLAEERLNFFRRTTAEEVRGACSPRALPSRELDTPSTTTPGSSRDSSITTEEGEEEETRAARVRLSSSSTILSGSRTPVDKVTVYADPNISKTTTTIATQTEGGGDGGEGITGARGRASTSSSSVTDVTSTQVTYRRKFWSGKSSASSGSSQVCESVEGDAVTSSQDHRRDSHYLSVLFQDDDALEKALREFTEQYNLMKGEGTAGGGRSAGDARNDLQAA